MLMSLIALIIGRINSYYTAIPCAQIAHADPSPNATTPYAACTTDPTAWTAVKADLYAPQSLAEAMAGLQFSFGTAGMLAFIVHAAVVEVYLGLTPAESERLRRISRERRLERGSGGGEPESGGKVAEDEAVTKERSSSSSSSSAAATS